MLSFVARGLSLKRLDIFLTRASFRVVLCKAKACEKSARKGTEMLHFFSTLHASQKKRFHTHKRARRTKREDSKDEEERMKKQHASSSSKSSQKVCLCFHGFSQNGLVFRQRTGSIRTKTLKREYEFVFLDAPHRVDGVFDVDDVNDEKNIEKRENEETMRSWWLAGENVSSGATKAKDGSWIRPAKSTKIVRLEETVALIENALKEHEGRVRALVGFSQGATLIGILNRVKPELFENVRRVVSVAGFDPLDARFYEKDGFVIDVPSMHVHGKNDALVTRDRSDRLRDKFYNKEKSVVFEHEGGHGVPTSREFREAFEKFLLMIPDGEGKDE
jgi:predicted esterase